MCGEAAARAAANDVCGNVADPSCRRGDVTHQGPRRIQRDVTDTHIERRAARGGVTGSAAVGLRVPAREGTAGLYQNPGVTRYGDRGARHVCIARGYAAAGVAVAVVGDAELRNLKRADVTD